MKPVYWKRLQGICCLGLATALVPVNSSAVINSNDNSPVVPPDPPAVTAVIPAPPEPSMPPEAMPSKLTGPAREVVKLISSGVSEDVVRTYVENSPYSFNLSPDAVIELHQSGVPNSIATTMLTHDKMLRQNSANAVTSMSQPMAQPQAPAPNYQYPQAAENSATLPSDYYNQLAPIGTWAYQQDYGLGWQPSVGISYSTYPWWLWGCGGWSYLPSSGWCWFPHARFNGGFGRYGYGGFGRYGGYYGHNFGGYGGYNHFYGGRSFGGFNHSFAGGGHSLTWGGGGHSFAAHSFSGGGHSSGGGGGGHFSGGGGGHSGGGGHR